MWAAGKTAEREGRVCGFFVPMLTTVHTYGNFADFSEEVYAAMAKEFNRCLKSFLYTGTPNGAGVSAEWSTWDRENKQTLIFDADDASSRATVEMQNVYKTNADIIAEIESDITLPEEIKSIIISTIMNGRWFSDDLDSYYGTPSLW